ncbi:MAG: class I SAM-dependent methyltransferase [Clostridiales bacterium]|nr:class I SAM-dependent methyltransferase [Clostridiales bacterium]
MSNYITKPWDWSKNTDSKWLIPCTESAFLAERWKNLNFSNFLDLGCGLGRHSIYMASHGFDVTSVDLSDYGINYLNEWSKKENLTIKTAISNMLSLPFPDNSFDCIMAYNVIYHTDTNGFIATLNEVKRILKPDGELFITLISKNTYSFKNADKNRLLDQNTLLRDEDETEKNVPHFYVNIDDIKKLFSDWNFELTPVEFCEYNMGNTEFYSTHWTLLVKKN